MLGACEVLVLQEEVGCTPEVREMSPRLWTTRELPAPWNITPQELSQRPPSQHQDQAPLKDQQTPVLDASHQTFSKTGEHSPSH